MDHKLDWNLQEESNGFVEYRIFVENDDLETTRVEFLKFFDRFICNYIWQEDQFDLKVWNSSDLKNKSKGKASTLKNAPSHLYYRLQFGDCIEDEWFILFLLVQLTSNEELQKMYNPICSIQDNDGEFLLIEAAYELPKWISKPKNAVNRVFIYQGYLHIVPRCISIFDPSSFGTKESNTKNFDKINYPSIPESLNFIREYSYASKVEDTLQKAAFQKIEKYSLSLPKLQSGDIDSLQEQHFACAFIPKYLISLIKSTNMLSKAIYNLYTPEVSLGKKQNLFEKPKLEKLDETKIWIRIRFSHWLFAQLNFFTIPQNIKKDFSNYSKQEAKGMDLGEKLTFAFHALYHCSLILKNQDTVNEYKHLLYLQCEDYKLERSSLPKDDNENWMNVSEEEINDLLKEKQEEIDNYTKKKTNQTKDSKNPKSIDDLLKNISNFMESSSGLDGVEFGDEDSSSTDSSFYSDDGEFEEDDEIKELMAKMDEEIYSESNLSKDFETVEVDGEMIVDENINFLKQLLSSLEEQPGTSNALTNLVSSLRNK